MTPHVEVHLAAVKHKPQNKEKKKKLVVDAVVAAGLPIRPNQRIIDECRLVDANRLFVCYPGYPEPGRQAPGPIPFRSHSGALGRQAREKHSRGNRWRPYTPPQPDGLAHARQSAQRTAGPAQVTARPGGARNILNTPAKLLSQPPPNKKAKFHPRDHEAQKAGRPWIPGTPLVDYPFPKASLQEDHTQQRPPRRTSAGS